MKVKSMSGSDAEYVAPSEDFPIYVRRMGNTVRIHIDKGQLRNREDYVAIDVPTADLALLVAEVAAN